MKKIITIVLSLVIIVACAFTMLACTSNKEIEIADATDLIVEDYGIAVNKNNATLLASVNKTITTLLENGKMEQYVEYYTALDDYSKGTDANAVAPVAPEGLTTTWNFGNATEKIIVFTEAGFAPFEYYYNENIVGVDIAIMSEVALSLGKKIEVRDIIFDNIPTEVQNATTDAVGAAGLTITDERAEVVNFSNVYFSTTLVILSEKSSNLTKVSDLAGLRVGVQKGTTGDLIISAAATENGYNYVDYDEVDQKVLAAGAKVSQYEQYALAYADLKAGRIDAILMDKLPALSLLKTVG
jgi:ABC-type amino acid transport substrate-binding protein